MIEVKNLSKAYDAKHPDIKALDNVSVTLPNKGFVAITGENGCGKTTLLNAISTMDDDYTGTILYNGVDYRTITDSLRSGIISFVFQEKMFVHYLNIRENLRLFSDVDKTDDTIATELEKYNIPEKIDADPTCMSGGQAQRASFIRGVIKSSDIFLVDEPTSSMNEDMERAVFMRLRELSKDKLVILVSHNIGMIRNFSDIIIHMDHGKIIDCEKNSSNSITYEGNCAIVPNGFSSLSSIDKKFVEDSLNNVGELRIKVDNKKKEAYVPDYTPDVQRVNHKMRRMASKEHSHIAFTSLLNQKWGMLSVTLLACFFSLLTSILISFAMFNTNEFTYKSLKENVLSDIGFIYDGTINAENRAKKDLTLDDFDYMRYTYGTKGTVLMPLETDVVKLPFKSNDTFSSTVTSWAYCTEDDIELLSGKFAVDGEVMLTDYHADGLIAGSEEYASYDDIIAKGIVTENAKLKVSGIVKTDYKKFLQLLEDPTLPDANKVDYRYLQNVYECIYLPNFWSEDVDAISYLCDDYDKMLFKAVFTDAYNDKLSTGSESTCVINKTFADKLGIVDDGMMMSYIKFGSIAGNPVAVVDDGKDENIVYFATSARNFIVKSYISSESLSMMLDINSADEVEYLIKKRMTHNTQVSAYIKDTVSIVSTLKNIFTILFAGLIAVMIAVAFIIVNKSVQNDKKLYVFMMTAGFRPMDYSLIQAIKLAIVLVVEAVVSSAVFYFGTMLANVGLSSAFNCTILIFEFRLEAMLAPVAAVFVGLFIALVVNMIKLRKTRLIKFIK